MTKSLHAVAALLILGTSPIFAQPAAPLVGGSDSCFTPDLIAGLGPFAFDNTLATTGTDGQTTQNCFFYNQSAIARDVWFYWTAPQAGRVLLSTCGQTTVDTKIAVYAGSLCPGPSATALACNDDITSSGVGNLQSFLEFDVTAGGQYLVQVGTYFTALGGTGTFGFTYVGGVQCQYDDGTTDYASEIGTNGTLRSSGWMYRVGEPGVLTRVTTVSSAWGWTNTGTPLAPGLIGEVGVWEDPNDDGDPSDAVLLATASAPMQNPHTDLLQAIPLPAPVTASGYFFIAAWVQHTGGFPVPRDIGGCASRPGVGWLLGNEPGALNTTNLMQNFTPPFQAPNGQTYVFLLRADCEVIEPGTVFCAGDGVPPHNPCPCGNHSPAADGAGCLSSFGVGARLRSSGIASLAGDTVRLNASHLPASSTLFFQGTSQQSGGNGAAFGDGLRCAGGTVIRLKTYPATGIPGAATSSYPALGDPSVSVRGNVTTPGTRTYQAWYRNSAAYCSVSTFNLSNGLEIVWSP